MNENTQKINEIKDFVNENLTKNEILQIKWLLDIFEKKKHRKSINVVNSN